MGATGCFRKLQPGCASDVSGWASRRRSVRCYRRLTNASQRDTQSQEFHVLTDCYLSDVLHIYTMKMSQQNSRKTMGCKTCCNRLEHRQRTKSAPLPRLYAIRAKFRLNRKSCPEGFGVSELFLGVWRLMNPVHVKRKSMQSSYVF